MAKEGFKLNRKGVAAMLKSSGVQSVCIAYAHRLANNDSGEHSINSRVGKNRVNAEILLKGADVQNRKRGLMGK